MGGSAPKFSSGAIEQLLVEDSTSTALLCAAQAAPPPAFRWKIHILSEEKESFFEICAQIFVLVCSACCQLYICTTRRNNWSRFYCSHGGSPATAMVGIKFLGKEWKFRRVLCSQSWAAQEIPNPSFVEYCTAPILTNVPSWFVNKTGWSQIDNFPLTEITPSQTQDIYFPQVENNQVVHNLGSQAQELWTLCLTLGPYSPVQVQGVFLCCHGFHQRLLSFPIFGDNCELAMFDYSRDIGLLFSLLFCAALLLPPLLNWRRRFSTKTCSSTSATTPRPNSLQSDLRRLPGKINLF